MDIEAIWISEIRPLLPVIEYLHSQLVSKQHSPRGREVGEPIARIEGEIRSMIS